jgi:hypothetical protein
MFQAFSEAVGACDTLDGVRVAFRNEIAALGYTASACRFFALSKSGGGWNYFFRDCPRSRPKLSDARNSAGGVPFWRRRASVSLRSPGRM